MLLHRHTFFGRALLSTLALTGCVDNFDPRLYQAHEAETGARDGGIDAAMQVDDAGTDAGDDASMAPDGGSDGGADGGSDAGIPALVLADFCTTGSVPMIPRPPSPTDAVSTAYLIDTTTLADDSADVAACTGVREPGRDGFASVMMMANERWHFHLRRPTGANAALYILDSSCDERTCSGGQGQDLCGTSSDEHFSFVAPSTGLYFLAVDNETAGVGFTGELDVIHPVCGNHAREHSEGCDDGGTMPGDGCDAVCRTELMSGASEAESNDDPYSANHLVLATVGPTSVIGHVASACESDVFAFDIPAAHVGNVTVSLGLSTGGCPTDNTVPIALSVLSPDGSNVLAATTLGAAGGCPMVGGTGSTLMALTPGTYYARVRSIGTMAPDRPFDYRLSVDVALTP
jgi:cysteine-rich repeat protein